MKKSQKKESKGEGRVEGWKEGIIIREERESEREREKKNVCDYLNEKKKTTLSVKCQEKYNNILFIVYFF